MPSWFYTVVSYPNDLPVETQQEMFEEWLDANNISDPYTLIEEHGKDGDNIHWNLITDKRPLKLNDLLVKQLPTLDKAQLKSAKQRSIRIKQCTNYKKLRHDYLEKEPGRIVIHDSISLKEKVPAKSLRSVFLNELVPYLLNEAPHHPLYYCSIDTAKKFLLKNKYYEFLWGFNRSTDQQREGSLTTVNEILNSLRPTVTTSV